MQKQHEKNLDLSSSLATTHHLLSSFSSIQQTRGEKNALPWGCFQSKLCINNKKYISKVQQELCLMQKYFRFLLTHLPITHTHPAPYPNHHNLMPHTPTLKPCLNTQTGI